MRCDHQANNKRLIHYVGSVSGVASEKGTRDAARSISQDVARQRALHYIIKLKFSEKRKYRRTLSISASAMLFLRTGNRYVLMSYV